jgi:hypothetical protein
MPHNERKTGLDWLRQISDPAEAIRFRWARYGVVFNVNAIAKLAETFGFIAATAEYRPEVAAGLIASLEHSMDRMTALYDVPIESTLPVYVRHGEREHRIERTPGRVICVVADRTVFSLGYAIFKLDAVVPDSDAEPDQERTVHAWMYSGCIGRPHIQYRYVGNGGLNYRSSVAADEMGALRPTLKFERGDSDTDRWSLNA